MDPPPVPQRKRSTYPLSEALLQEVLSRGERTLFRQLQNHQFTSSNIQPISNASRKRERTPMVITDDDMSSEDSISTAGPLKRRLLSSPNIEPVVPATSSSNNGNIGNTSQNDIMLVDNLPLPSPSASPTHQNQINDLDSDKIIIDLSTCNQSHSTWETTFNYINQLESNSMESKALLLSLLEKTDVHVLSNLYKVLGKALKKDLIIQLPIEITNKIFSQFDYKTLLNASEVCKQWNMITNYGYDLWKSLLLKDKMIVNEDEFNFEFKLIKSKRLDLNDSQILKLMYERRLGIKGYWMNPLFQPKVISLDAQSLGVITCLQFDSDKVVAGSDQSKIVIYDTETGAKRHELSGHGGGVWAMKYFKNTLASGSTDRTVRIWNIAQGKCTHIFKGHVSTVRCLEIVEPVQCGTDIEGKPIYFPTEPLLVTGSRDTTLNVWKLPMTEPNDDLPLEPLELEEIDNPFLLKKLGGHTNSVRALSGHCDTIISGSYDNKAIVWDLKTFTKKYELVGHTDRIYSCVYDWKRQQCYTGSVDNTVKIWDLKRGTLKAILEGHQILVGLISASDNVLVSAAADSTVRIWDPNTGASKHVLRGHGSAITCVENDDERIVSGSQGSLILWNAQTGERIRNLGDDITGAVWQVKFDYRRCVAAVQRGNQTVIEIVDFCPISSDKWMNQSN